MYFPFASVGAGDFHHSTAGRDPNLQAPAEANLFPSKYRIRQYLRCFVS